MGIYTGISTKWLFIHWFQIELEFRGVCFCRERKTGEPREKPSEQCENQKQTQPTYLEIKEILNIADRKANALDRYIVVIFNIFKPPCNFLLLPFAAGSDVIDIYSTEDARVPDVVSYVKIFNVKFLQPVVDALS